MRWVLWTAALFNMYWGGKLLFREGTHWPFALFLLALAVGYVLAGFQPRRHWGVVLVGLLAMVCGPIGWLMSETRADLPWANGWPILFYDVIWWIPFFVIVRKASKPRPPRQREFGRRSGRRPGDGPRSNRPSRPQEDRPQRSSGDRPGGGGGPGGFGPGGGSGPRRRRRRRGPRREGGDWRPGSSPSNPPPPSGPDSGS